MCDERSSGGFTFLETLMALGLLGICFALTLPFLSLQRELWARGQIYREEDAALAAALSWITRDLQAAGFGCPGPAVVTLEEEHLAYALSRGDDPALLSPADRRLVSVSRKGENLRYRIQSWDPDASSWKRGSSHTLARGIERVRIAGFDHSGNRVTEASAVAAVEMTLQGRKTGPQSVLVALRNRQGSSLP